MAESDVGAGTNTRSLRFRRRRRGAANRIDCRIDLSSRELPIATPIARFAADWKKLRS